MVIHYPHVDGRGRVTRRSVAPDVFVVLGVAKRRRYSYVVWQEGKVPDFVLEVLSPSSWRRDLGEKVEVYASLGVGEYFQFDPTGEWMEPRLQGLVLRGGTYERLGEAELSNGRCGVYSEALELYGYVDAEGELRWHDPATGEDLRTLEESERDRRSEAAARWVAEDRATAEATARRTAEARVAELEALVRKLRDGDGESP